MKSHHHTIISSSWGRIVGLMGLVEQKITQGGTLGSLDISWHSINQSINPSVGPFINPSVTLPQFSMNISGFRQMKPRSISCNLVIIQSFRKHVDASLASWTLFWGTIAFAGRLLKHFSDILLDLPLTWRICPLGPTKPKINGDASRRENRRFLDLVEVKMLNW